MKSVRVRFAPSPTGHLHIGAARTALFNWLFARHHQGQFILRIEDTDMARSSSQMSQGIIDGLQWLGLNWDDGPVFQSGRLKIYKQKAEKLHSQGYAYYCYCTPEEIQQRRKASISGGQYWKYDRRCLNLTQKEKERLEQEGRPKALRFLVPEGETSYHDLVHGEIAVENRNIEDFILVRRDGFPTYHLSVVVDDIDQRITHVIRGDDHISNTPKQILIYRALGALPPEFAHLPLILGPDRKKLSKRHGVTSVLQFKEDGFLPLAILNFLALMSWSPGKEERIYKVEELVEQFSLDKVSPGNPILHLEKLEWLNSQLISSMEAAELLPYVQEELKKENLWDESLSTSRKDWFLRLIDLLKVRSHTLKDFVQSARPFLTDEFTIDRAGAEKYLKDKRLKELLAKLKDDFLKISDFQAVNIEPVLRQRAAKEGVKAALFIHALRMLVVGKPVSPSLFAVLEMAGKEKTIKRMEAFLVSSK